MRQSYFDAHDAFQHYVDEHGAHLGSAALGDADTATTLRTAAGGARTVTDGPFAELAEQVGGYYDVELPDLDAAIAAARLLPSAYTVEIRPVIDDRGVRPAVTPGRGPRWRRCARSGGGWSPCSSRSSVGSTSSRTPSADAVEAGGAHLAARRRPGPARRPG